MVTKKKEDSNGESQRRIWLEVATEEKTIKPQEFLSKIKTENAQMFSEIAKFTELLKQCGVTSYQLSGSLQEPVVTTYSFM